MTTTITITELTYTAEQVKEVKLLETSSPVTERKSRIRQALGGFSPCCICSAVPSRKIIYNLDNIIRTETYCDTHFSSVFEKNRDVDINEIAQGYNCTKVEPGKYFGLGKKEYEQSF